MKKALLVAIVGALAISANAGEWAKAPVGGGKYVVQDKVPIDKHPIEECVDIGGNLSVAYETDYLYKGYRLGRDTVVTDVNYVFDRLAIPVTIGVTYANIINNGLVGDDLAFYAGISLPTLAGIEASLFYTHHFYPEDGTRGLLPAAGAGFGRQVNASGQGEIGLALSKDLGIFVVNFDAAYSIHAPNSWNEIAFNNDDRGAFYYDLGLEKAFGIGAHALILEGGVAYSDNYWGGASIQNTNSSSGWNHYYLRASLPIELNCRTTLTPYVGYQGAPDGWLMDGVANFGGRQSDILHGGVSLNVAF